MKKNKKSSKISPSRSWRQLLTPARLALTALVLSLVALTGASSCNSGDNITDANAGKPVPANPNNPSKPASGGIFMLPASVRDAEMRAVTGAPIKLADYSGKVVVLNLWATWCGPCRMEIPELVKVYKEYRRQGLEVIGLSTENPDASAELVKRFIQEYDMDYRVGWSPPAVSIALMRGRDAIPQSFVIARDGRIVKHFVGYNYRDTPPQLRRAIEEALKG